MLNKKVTFWIMTLLCSLSLVLAGCGAKDGQKSSEETEQKNEAQQAVKTTYTVQHAMGVFFASEKCRRLQRKIHRLAAYFLH